MAQPAYSVENIEVVARTAELQARIFTLAPGQEIPWHFHSAVTDWYFGLEGEVQIETRAPRRRDRLGPGATARVEPRTAHRVSNPSAARCRFLLLQGGGAYDYHPVEAAPA